MKNLLVVTVLLSSMICSIYGLSRTYSNCYNVNTKGLNADMKFHWTISGNNINIGVEAKSNGWIALGISNTTKTAMNSGNTYSDVFFITSNNVTGDYCNSGNAVGGCVADAANRGRSLIFDRLQSLTNMLVQKSPGYISGEFTRALVTNDPADDRAISTNTDMIFIWAINKNAVGQNGTKSGHGGDNGADYFTLKLSTASKCTTATTGAQATTAKPAATTAKPAATTAKAVATTSKATTGTTPAATTDSPTETPIYGSKSYKTIRADWEIDADRTNIQVTLTAQTKGWIGMGIARTGSMSGNVDMFIGWVNDNTKALTYLDAYSTSYSRPPSDESQGGTDNILTSSGSQNATHTTIKFSRKMYTGDSKDVTIIDSDLYILLASGDSDGTGNTFSQHTVNGAVKVNFYSSSPASGTSGGSAGTTTARAGTTTAASGADTTDDSSEPTSQISVASLWVPTVVLFATLLFCSL